MTNWFEQYYNELLDHTSKVIIAKKINAEKHEIVNDAYLKFVESGEVFDLGKVKKIISNISFDYVEEKQRSQAVGSRKVYANDMAANRSGYEDFSWKVYTYRRPRKNGHNACNKCHEVKQVNEFRLIKFNGYDYLSQICKTCEQKRHNEWVEKNREIWNKYMVLRSRASGAINRIEYNKKMSLQKKSIHELWKKANRKYQAKQKELLTDVYVRGILKASKKPFTPKAIAAKRKELFEKRRQGNITAK